MKKLMIALVAGLTSALAMAKGIEQVSVVENEMTTIAVPFGITSYLPSNMDVVRIEEVDGTTLRVTALRRGRCDLDVRGDKDLSQKYEITVLGDLATTLDTLNSELDTVQEVRARVVGDFIRIDGEISSIQKWEYLQKVIRNYKGVVRNFAIFSPGPDVMLRLKETLQDAGFTVVFQAMGKERKAWPANQIALVLNKATQMMTVQGRVYTPEQKAKVSECLSTERWLTLDLKPADGAATVDEYRIRSQFDVFFDKPQIRISVAYMAISDSDAKNIGNAQAQGGSMFNILGGGEIFGSLSKMRGILGTSEAGRNGGLEGTLRPRGVTGTANASLDVVTRFFRQNDISRISDTGYTVMESWDKDGAKFKSGGTQYVVVRGLNSGDLKDIEYGFMLSTVGGISADGNSLDAKIDFELSSIEDTSTSGEQYGINKKEDKTTQKLMLALGRTTFIGGVKMLDEQRLSPTGIPFIRNTPLLNWFVADSGTEINDKRLVIMICPEIVDNTKDGNLEVDKEINSPVPTEGAKSTEQREDEKRPFSGGLWNPLNWFAY